MGPKIATFDIKVFDFENRIPPLKHPCSRNAFSKFGDCALACLTLSQPLQQHPKWGVPCISVAQRVYIQVTSALAGFYNTGDYGGVVFAWAVVFALSHLSERDRRPREATCVAEVMRPTGAQNQMSKNGKRLANGAG